MPHLPSSWPGAAPRHGWACPGHPRLACRCRVAMPRVARGDRLAMRPAGLTPHGEERSERSASRTMRPATRAKDNMAQLNAASVQAADRHQDRGDKRRSFFPVETHRGATRRCTPINPTPSSTTRRSEEIEEGVCGEGGRSRCWWGGDKRQLSDKISRRLVPSLRPCGDNVALQTEKR